MENQVELVEQQLNLFGQRSQECLCHNKDVALLVETLNVAQSFTDAFIEWAKGEKTFDSWVGMVTEFYYNPVHEKLDPSGELRKIVDALFLIDLTPYFYEKIMPQVNDLGDLFVKRKMIQSAIQSLDLPPTQEV